MICLQFLFPLDSKEGWGPVYLVPCVSWERDITNTWMNENEYYHCIFEKKYVYDWKKLYQNLNSANLFSAHKYWYYI